MGNLNFIWEAREVPLKSKFKSHVAMPMNLLLWGSQNLSENKGDIQMCEALHHKAMIK